MKLPIPNARSFLALVSFALIAPALLGSAARPGPASPDPEDPRSYLVAGEWILIHAGDEAQRQHAREYLARALVYAHQRDLPRTASSACIALGASGLGPDAHRFFWDLALVIDPARRTEWENARRTTLAPDPELDAMVLACLSSVRLHDSPRGEELFARARVAERIRSLAADHGIDPDAMVDLIAREIENARSDSCRGRLFVGDRSSRGDRVVCPDHLRGVGLCANDRELAMFLALESTLAGAEARGWDAARQVGQTHAVTIPSVDEAVDRLAVRPGFPFYRDGRWVADP